MKKELVSIKEGTDVYYMPEEYPEYIFGQDSLKKLLKTIKIYRKEVDDSIRHYFVVRMIINEEGKVIQDSISVRGTVVDSAFYQRLFFEESLMIDWKPGMFNRKPVKTEINLPIWIDD